MAAALGAATDGQHGDATRGDARAARTLRGFALLCLAVPLLVYGVVGAWRWQQIQAEATVRLDRSLGIAQEHALKVFEVSEVILERVQAVVARQPGVPLAERSAELHAELRALAQGKPQYHSIWVHGPDGLAVASHEAPADGKGIDVSARDYYAWHRSGGGDATYFSGPYQGLVTGRPFFAMSRALRNADGSFGGVVVIALLPRYFDGFYGNLVTDEPGLAVNLLRRDGTIFTRSPQLANAPPRLASNSPVMSAIAAGQTAGRVEGVSSVDGRKRLLTFRQVGDFPVFVGTGMDTGRLLERWRRDMLWLAAFGLPPMLGLFLVGRSALRRTREAELAAQRLREETAARQRVEQSLLQAQKLEALGRLTGGVAHDVNNAMMVISNSLYLLKARHPGDALAEAAPIGRAVESVTKLTRQLLAFSRRQALMPEVVRLQDRLPQLESLIGPMLGARIALSLRVDADTAPVLVDNSEFELGVLNLALNARDAMPDGGRVDITAGNAASPPPGLSGRFVVVAVSDTGTGIPPELLDKVFEPFFTTKPVGQGTGLGLSQVYGLCERAGGRATIASTPGRGTTVSLFLPAAAGAVAEARPSAEAQAHALGLSVLLVEDNAEVGESLEDLLEAMQCRVTRLHSADEARQWLLRHEPPEVLLSDVVMPGEMDGLALANLVRSRWPQIKIVLMTGHAQHLPAIAAEGFELLPKPCSASVLAATLMGARGRD
jgi:signal transduction histidine kinase